MTGNKVFLDTNIIIDVFAGNKIIVDKISNWPAYYISSVVLGELYVGINRVVDRDKHLNKLKSFLKLCIILDVDHTTAQLYGEIIVALYKKGKPIPTNDIWIAATVKQYDLTLITRDKHFAEVNDLLLESW